MKKTFSTSARKEKQKAKGDFSEVMTIIRGTTEPSHRSVQR